MTASHHPLPLTRPLRGLRLGGTLPASCDEALLAQRERAGFERGRTEGQRELNDELMRQRTELLELQNGVLESLRQALPQVLRDCEQALTALALEVAQKLVAGLPISGEMVESAVREALEQVEETAAYHIYLPPDDLALLQQMNSELISAESGAPALHFHPAPELARGGCLVKTRFGIIDARRETKIELLRQSLLT